MFYLFLTWHLHFNFLLFCQNYQRGFGIKDNANAFMASASPADSGESAQAELVYDERLWVQEYAMNK